MCGYASFSIVLFVVVVIPVKDFDIHTFVVDARAALMELKWTGKASTWRAYEFQTPCVCFVSTNAVGADA